MLTKTYYFVAFILLAFYGCSAPKIFVEQKKTDDAGRLLSYEQAEVADAFLDSLLSHPADSATLKTVLLPPPPPPPPAFKQVQGYRVQVFASRDSAAALLEKMKVRPAVRDSIYLVKENGFYKIQIGDFRFYPKADSLRNSLIKRQYPKAWIPKTMIRVPNIEAATDTTASVQNIPAAEAAPFRIQVFVTADEARALQIVQELQKDFSPANYQKVSAKFKIFVGRFPSRAAALKVLARIKIRGYSDAFIVTDQ